MFEPQALNDNTLPFFPLAHINTTAATPSNEAFENVKKNLIKNYPRMQALSEFTKVKGMGVPIALAGGGPSIKKELDNLRKFKTIIACGSSHDYLIKNDIIPTYCAVCDPDPIIINYLQLKHPEVKYLIASACHENIFKYLEGMQIILWHCHSPEIGNKIFELEKEKNTNYEAIGGGCTVGLRSLSIAIMFGYGNIHLFGFDSCMSENEHHAYEFFDPEKEQMGELYKIRIGMDKARDDKTYLCAGYQLAQVAHFKDFYIAYREVFKPTFHGTGLLPDFMQMINDETEKLMVKSA